MKKRTFIQTKVKSYSLYLKKPETVQKLCVYQSITPKRTMLPCCVMAMVIFSGNRFPLRTPPKGSYILPNR